jgi:hypothetical protein
LVGAPTVSPARSSHKEPQKRSRQRNKNNHEEPRGPRQAANPSAISHDGIDHGKDCENHRDGYEKQKESNHISESRHAT